MKTHDYLTCCINLSQDEGYLLHDAMEAALEISWSTFSRHCHWRDVATLLGYTPDSGLTLKGDYHVRFYKLKWEGKKCYALKWSGIEYIFSPMGTRTQRVGVSALRGRSCELRPTLPEEADMALSDLPG